MPHIVTLPLPDRNTTEEQINKIIPVLNDIYENHPSLTGFSGNCWSAAYAINKVLLNNQGVVVAALNKAAYLNADRSIGHVVVHYLTDEQGSDFIDMQGFKTSDNIDSWGMLDPEDDDYIKLFDIHHIPLTDENFENIVWIEYSMEELENMLDPDILESYINTIETSYQKLFPIVKKPKYK